MKSTERQLFIRAFIALPIEERVRLQMGTLIAELYEQNADARWESAEKLHITLKFLGDTSHETLRTLAEQLESSLHSFQPFEVTYVGVGVFPSPSHPRIVWVGTEPNELLMSMQLIIEDSCQAIGFKKEDRPFHPHVTIGRVKSQRNLHRLTDKLKSITFEPVKSLCTGVHIMQSHLLPTGSRYSILKTISLT